MSTPVGIRHELDELDRLAAAIDTYADLHQRRAQERGDDDTEEHWYWVGVTAHTIHRHIDQLEQHLAKLGVITRPSAHDER